MESSGQVTKTEEIMINGEDNDASKTCQDAVKRTGKRTAVSQYCGELSRERSSERDPYYLDAILGSNTIHPGRYVILERSRSSTEM